MSSGGRGTRAKHEYKLYKAKPDRISMTPHNENSKFNMRPGESLVAGGQELVSIRHCKLGTLWTKAIPLGILTMVITMALVQSAATEPAACAAVMQSQEASQPQPEYQVPVIGILTQVLRDYRRFTDKRHLHLASSYVKWIESAGAQVVPILLNQNDSYYERMFMQTNGLLLPGGDNLLDPTKNTPMMVAAKKLYRLAVEANDKGDFYPIWGTCLGLELLSVVSANRNVLAQCSANDISLPMRFVDRGKLFAPSTYSDIDLGIDYSGAMVGVMSNKNITYNFHHKCLTDKGLSEAGLTKFYKPLAYSIDKSGLKFIAIFEAFDYPFFGVQFHPEKPPFEFVVKKSQTQISHSRQAIAVSRYFADFFVGQAGKSKHSRGCNRDLENLLIYAHNPTYTAPKNDMYEQRYLFPYESNGLDEEEFLDYVPDSDEEAPEDVNRPEGGGDIHFGKIHSKSDTGRAKKESPDPKNFYRYSQDIDMI